MPRVAHVQFTDGWCRIPAEIAPPTYRKGTRRWLYYLDRMRDESGQRLRELVLLPCGPHEISRLYSVTLGIKNTPGATAAGTDLMRAFELSLKIEEAYDCCAGDIGSKTFLVVFPNRVDDPASFDQFIANHVRSKGLGSQFIRKAKNTALSVRANYSSAVDVHFGQYAMIRRFLDPLTFPQFIGEIEIKQDSSDVQSGPESLVLGLSDVQQRRVLSLLAGPDGNKRALDGKDVHVSCDEAFEALTFSFLDADDILCSIQFQFVGEMVEVNQIVKWFGDQRVDFRQYQVVRIEGEGGYEFRLLCDLGQTDYFLFHSATLREVLYSELENILPALEDPQKDRLRNFEVKYTQPNLVLYDSFVADRDRFHLACVIYIREGKANQIWPPTFDDQQLLTEIVKLSNGATPRPTTLPIPNFGSGSPNFPQRSVVIGLSEKDGFSVAAVCDNNPPPGFLGRFRDFCNQPLPKDGKALERLLRTHLFRGLNFALLSPDQFSDLGNRRRDEFRTENDERFSSLGWNYIEEKLDRDTFAFQGNIVLAGMLDEYLRSTDADKLRARLAGGNSSDRVRILDVGPGVGALTTTLMLRRNSLLWTHLEKVDLTFIDAAQGVLDLNRNAQAKDFLRFPSKVLEALQISGKAELDRLIATLQKANHVCCDISDLTSVKKLLQENPIGPFDIVYSGFCHHHMNNEMKANACRAMVDFARDDAFVGVVDESLTYKQYLLYRVGHSLDQVQVATESYFQSWGEHAKLLGPRFQVIGRQPKAGNHFYAFWGIVSPRQNPRVFFSYRRNGGSEIARAVYERLKLHGYRAFLDVEDIGGPTLSEALLEEVRNSDAVVVILSKGALDGIKGQNFKPDSSNPNWFHGEMATARKHQRVVIGISEEGFALPNHPLPRDIRFITDSVWVPYNHQFFDATLEKLMSRLKSDLSKTV